MKQRRGQIERLLQDYHNAQPEPAGAVPLAPRIPQPAGLQVEHYSTPGPEV